MLPRSYTLVKEASVEKGYYGVIAPSEQERLKEKYPNGIQPPEVAQPAPVPGTTPPEDSSVLPPSRSSLPPASTPPAATPPAATPPSASSLPPSRKNLPPAWGTPTV